MKPIGIDAVIDEGKHMTVGHVSRVPGTLGPFLGFLRSVSSQFLRQNVIICIFDQLSKFIPLQGFCGAQIGHFEQKFF